MTKRGKEMWSQKRTLKDSGWDVYQSDRYNSGSETLAHSLCKAIVGHYLAHEYNFNVCFEVAHEGDRGELDLLAWSEEDILCVECETAPEDDVISDKLDRYVHGTPIREMFTLDPLEMPAEWMEAYKWVDEQLFQSIND